MWQRAGSCGQLTGYAFSSPCFECFSLKLPGVEANCPTPCFLIKVCSLDCLLVMIQITYSTLYLITRNSISNHSIVPRISGHPVCVQWSTYILLITCSFHQVIQTLRLLMINYNHLCGHLCCDHNRLRKVQLLFVSILTCNIAFISSNKWNSLHLEV